MGGERCVLVLASETIGATEPILYSWREVRISGNDASTANWVVVVVHNAAGIAISADGGPIAADVAIPGFVDLHILFVTGFSGDCLRRFQPENPQTLHAAADCDSRDDDGNAPINAQLRLTRCVIQSKFGGSQVRENSGVET